MTGFNHGRFAYQTPQGQFDRGELDDTGAMVGGELTSKSDLEALLPMSGYCELSWTDGWNNDTTFANQFIPLNSQVGDTLGCEIDPEDGIILNAAGMWRTEFFANFSINTVSDTAETRLELFDPDDNFVQRTKIRMAALSGAAVGLQRTPIYVFDNVVVDRPGYRVRVYAVTNNGQYNTEPGAIRLGAQYVYNGTPRFSEEG